MYIYIYIYIYIYASMTVCMTACMSACYVDIQITKWVYTISAAYLLIKV